MSDALETRQHQRVLHLSLNRPEKRNALNGELCTALVEAIERAGRSPGIGAILLTGNGKSFCAGMDLEEMGSATQDTLSTLHEQLFTIGSRLTLPLVAGVNGAALGGGMGLVANCHIVVASERATFGLTEIRLGLWPFLVYRALTAAVGERRTLELSLTGRTFGAEAARETGLIHEISAQPEARAAELAAALAAASPTAIRAGLRFVREVRGKNWQHAGEIARQIRNRVFASADFQEGVRAFREKRPPQWPSVAESGGMPQDVE
jgi:enoyl-CoA hydratase/carnithine racemase